MCSLVAACEAYDHRAQDRACHLFGARFTETTPSPDGFVYSQGTAAANGNHTIVATTGGSGGWCTLKTGAYRHPAGAAGGEGVMERTARACRATNRVRLQDYAAQHMLTGVGGADGDRPWSVTSPSFPLGAGLRLGHRECSTVPEVLAAVRYGVRVWPDGRPAAEHDMGAELSWFEASCAIPRFTPARVCKALALYDQVFLIGDSLMRHLWTAFKIAVSGDWELAGQTREQFEARHNTGIRFGPGTDPGVWEKHAKHWAAEHPDCRCDGLFSEVLACRQDGSVEAYPSSGCALFSRVRYDHMRGMNSGNRTGVWATSFLNRESQEGGTGDLCSETGRKLIAVNGGLHQQLDPHTFLKTVLLPELREVEEATATCPHVRRKLDIVVMQVDSQTGAMDAKYPNQGTGPVFAFNEHVAAYLAEHHPGVLVFRSWNLTRGCGRSDGLHLLTEANVAKASALLRMMEIAGA